MPLSLTGAAKPALLELPWSLPLEEWPEPIVVALPRGISRHVVRFARMGERIIAIKETNPAIAAREFTILRELRRLGAPCVKPVAVVRGREGADGRDLEAALVTEHLQFSLPYRALFSQALDEDTVSRFLDALAVLLVRLHLLGFYWGDVSLSNALFRRDAAEFSAYLVDAETGDLHAKLTDGQRAYDLEIARTNIAGVGGSKRELARLKRIAAQELKHGRPLIEDPSFAARVAQVEIELLALEITNLRVVSAESERRAPGPEASLLKIKGTEIQQAIAELVMQAVGPYALPFQRRGRGEPCPHGGPAHAAPAGATYCNLRKASIYGGSNEIQRSIISSMILGL